MVLSILAYVAAIIYVVLLHIKKELSMRILGIILLVACKYSRLSKGHLDSFFFTKLHSTNLDGTRDIQNETFFSIFCEFKIQSYITESLKTVNRNILQ